MSDEHAPVRLSKWPFYLADLLLSAVVVFVLYQLGTFEGTADMVIVAGCLAAAAVAAWISIIPWLREHEARLHLNESSNLKSSVEQIQGIEKVADLIRQSNAQWQGIQDASARTVTSAKEITERMRLEAEEFMKFLSNAQDQERAGLRLEVEKLRRMEGDWIKVVVQILDHVYALFRAAERSGQRNLITQLTHFQGSCRDVARRIGLAAFVPERGETFDPRGHQLADARGAVPEGARIGEVVAPGFTYQGALLRRSLVVLEGAVPQAVEPEARADSELESAEAQPREAEAAAGQTESEAVPEMEPGIQAAEAMRTEESDGPEMDENVEVFESLEQLEPPAEVESATEPPAEAPAAQGREAVEPEASQAKKKTPQEELPF